MKFTLLLFLFLLPSSFVFAQEVNDFENIENTTQKGFLKDYFKEHFKGFFKDFKTGSPFQINGGLGLTMRSYSAFGIENRQDPFFYSFNANVNAQFYKLNVPFSILLTARNKEYAYPNLTELKNAFKSNTPDYQNRFVRIGASPFYKWAKVHLGHRTMNFSPLTLSNINFLGVGTELNPGKVRVAAMYGRLAPARPQDLAINQPNITLYQRKGYGLKLGYGTQTDFIDFIAFKAQDDPNSIHLPLDSLQNFTANENLVVGINIQKKILEKFILKLEYAGSAFSADRQEQNLEGQNNLKNPFPYPNFLFTRRFSTEFRKAFDGSLTYQFSAASIGFQVKRIDPKYRSLGTFFFNDDMLNYTINANWTLLQGKLQFATTGGIQQNNLDNQKPTTIKRLIGSLNATYSLEKLNLTATYSNYTSSVDYLINDTADSLNSLIVTQDASLNASYNWGSEMGNKHVLTAILSLQQVTDDVESNDISAASQMYVFNLSYSLMLPNDWRITTRANYNQNQLSIFTSNRYGGGFGVNKSFLAKKLQLGIDANLFSIQTENQNSTLTLNSRLNANWKVSNSHSLVLNTGYIYQNKKTITVPTNFSELITTIGYVYRFSYQPSSK